MGNTESTCGSINDGEGKRTNMRRQETVRQQETVSKPPTYTKPTSEHNRPQFNVNDPPWSYLADEHLWQELWKNHSWSLSEVEWIRGLFKSLQKQNRDAPTLPSTVVHQFMLNSNPFLASIENDIGVAITVGQSQAITTTQFLRIASLCDISTPHEIAEASGRLRIALIFAMYDRGFKGYLNEHDFSVMKHDITKIYGYHSPVLPVSILDLIAKTSPYLRDGRPPGNFNNPKIDFELFKASVENQVLRGTSQLMRARFQSHDSHQVNQPLPQGVVNVGYQPYMMPNASIQKFDFSQDPLEQTMTGTTFQPPNDASLYLANAQVNQLIGVNQIPPQLNVLHQPYQYAYFASQNYVGSNVHEEKETPITREGSTRCGEYSATHSTESINHVESLNQSETQSNVIAQSTAHCEWSRSVNRYPEIKKDEKALHPLESPDSAYPMDNGVPNVHNKQPIPLDNNTGSNDTLSRESRKLRNDSLPDTRGYPLFSQNFPSSEKLWPVRDPDQFAMMAKPSVSLRSPHFSPPPRIFDSFQPASPPLRPTTKDPTSESTPSRSTWPRDNDESSKEGAHPPVIGYRGVTTTTGYASQSGAVSPSSSHKYSRNTSINSIHDETSNLNGISNFRLQPNANFSMEEIEALRQCQIKLSAMHPAHFDCDLLLFLAAFHKSFLSQSPHAENLPVEVLVRTVSQGMQTWHNGEANLDNDAEEIVDAVSEILAPYLSGQQIDASAEDVASVLLSHFEQHVFSLDYHDAASKEAVIEAVSLHASEVMPDVQAVVLQARECLLTNENGSPDLDVRVPGGETVNKRSSSTHTERQQSLSNMDPVPIDQLPRKTSLASTNSRLADDALH